MTVKGEKYEQRDTGYGIPSSFQTVLTHSSSLARISSRAMVTSPPSHSWHVRKWKCCNLGPLVCLSEPAVSTTRPVLRCHVSVAAFCACTSALTANTEYAVLPGRSTNILGLLQLWERQMMEDRLYRGFVAGAIGGVVASALSHLAYFWGFTTLRLSDWAAILIFAHVPPFSIEEQIFSAFIHIGWCGALGSIFAYFLVWATSRKLLFKAWMLGTTPYFIIYLLTSLFQTPGTVPLPFKTALSNYITSTIFSVVMGYSFKVLDEATMQHRSPLELLAQPAAKRTDEDKSQHRPDNDERDGT